MEKNDCLIRIPPDTKRRLIKMKGKRKVGVGKVVTELVNFRDLNSNKKMKRRIIEELEF